MSLQIKWFYKSSIAAFSTVWVFILSKYFKSTKYWKLSPFSKKFVAYENLTEEEKQNKIHNTAIKSITTANNNSNNNTRIDYYIKRGATPEEAEQLLKERQTTFSLKICIEKYGLEEGCKRFATRQTNWQHNTKTGKGWGIHRP